MLSCVIMCYVILILYCIVLYFIVFYCIVLYCIVLYCIELLTYAFTFSASGDQRCSCCSICGRISSN